MASKKHTPFRRFVSCVLLAAFFITNHFPQDSAAHAAPAPLESTSASKIPQDLNLIQLPANFGSIQETFAGSGNQTVVIVQDAHAIPDAQKSIQKIIAFFKKQYGVRTVALEGASAKLDPQIFKSFPEKKILKQVFKEYLQRGELTAGTGAAIFLDGMEFHGVEDWSLYEKGLGLYLAALKRQPDYLQKVEAEKIRLQSEKEKTYSAPLLELDRKLEAFGRNEIQFTEILKTASGYLAPEKGSVLDAFASELKDENKSTEAVDLEVIQIAESVKEYLDNTSSLRGALFAAKQSDLFVNNGSVSSKQKKIASRSRKEGSARNDKRVREFNHQYQQFQTGQISPQAFILFLKEIIALERIKIPVSNSLANAADQQKQMRDVEGTAFFREFEKYVDSVKASLMKNDKERALDKESQLLRLTEKLIKLELSREEWDEIKAYRKQRAKSIGQRAEDRREALFTDLKIQEMFYENAEKRDRAFLENLEKLPVPQSAQPVRLLIAGGFHAQGLMQRLRDKKISYLLVMPRIQEIPKETHYQEHMRGDVSWKNYFKAENGKINLYKAFVRGTRDRLLGKPDARSKMQDAGENSESWILNPESRLLLKAWRDQIILDLAEMKQIEKAGEYTKFIDEVMQDSGSKIQDKKSWVLDPGSPLLQKAFERIDRFVAGLGKLQAENKLTERNIMKLANPAAFSDPTGAVGDPVASIPPAQTLLERAERGVFDSLSEVVTGASVPGTEVPGTVRAEARKGAYRLTKNEKEKLRQLVESAQGLRTLLHGSFNQSVEQVFGLENPMDPQFPYVVKIYKAGSLAREREALEFAKKNMGGFMTPFTILENVKVNETLYSWAVIQARRITFSEDLGRIENTFSLSDRREFAGLHQQEKDLITRSVERGILLADALIPKNYGIDPQAGKLEFIDHMFASAGNFEDAFKSWKGRERDRDYYSRREKKEYEFYKGMGDGFHLDLIGVAVDDELARLWGTKRKEVTPLDDVRLPGKAAEERPQPGTSVPGTAGRPEARVGLWKEGQTDEVFAQELLEIWRKDWLRGHPEIGNLRIQRRTYSEEQILSVFFSGKDGKPAYVSLSAQGDSILSLESAGVQGFKSQEVMRGIMNWLKGLGFKGAELLVNTDRPDFLPGLAELWNRERKLGTSSADPVRELGTDRFYFDFKLLDLSGYSEAGKLNPPDAEMRQAQPGTSVPGTARARPRGETRVSLTAASGLFTQEEISRINARGTELTALAGSVTSLETRSLLLYPTLLTVLLGVKPAYFRKSQGPGHLQPDPRELLKSDALRQFAETHEMVFQPRYAYDPQQAFAAILNHRDFLERQGVLNFFDRRALDRILSERRQGRAESAFALQKKFLQNLFEWYEGSGLLDAARFIFLPTHQLRAFEGVMMGYPLREVEALIHAESIDPETYYSGFVNYSGEETARYEYEDIGLMASPDLNGRIAPETRDYVRRMNAALGAVYKPFERIRGYESVILAWRKIRGEMRSEDREISTPAASGEQTEKTIARINSERTPELQNPQGRIRSVDDALEREFISVQAGYPFHLKFFRMRALIKALVKVNDYAAQKNWTVERARQILEESLGGTEQMSIWMGSLVAVLSHDLLPQLKYSRDAAIKFNRWILALRVIHASSVSPHKVIGWIGVFQVSAVAAAHLLLFVMDAPAWRTAFENLLLFVYMGGILAAEAVSAEYFKGREKIESFRVTLLWEILERETISSVTLWSVLSSSEKASRSDSKKAARVTEILEDLGYQSRKSQHEILHQILDLRSKNKLDESAVRLPESGAGRLEKRAEERFEPGTAAFGPMGRRIKIPGTTFAGRLYPVQKKILDDFFKTRTRRKPAEENETLHIATVGLGGIDLNSSIPSPTVFMDWVQALLSRREKFEEMGIKRVVIHGFDTDDAVLEKAVRGWNENYKKYWDIFRKEKNLPLDIEMDFQKGDLLAETGEAGYLPAVSQKMDIVTSSNLVGYFEGEERVAAKAALAAMLGRPGGLAVITAGPLRVNPEPVHLYEKIALESDQDVMPLWADSKIPESELNETAFAGNSLAEEYRQGFFERFSPAVSADANVKPEPGKRAEMRTPTAEQFGIAPDQHPFPVVLRFGDEGFDLAERMRREAAGTLVPLMFGIPSLAQQETRKFRARRMTAKADLLDQIPEFGFDSALKAGMQALFFPADNGRWTYGYLLSVLSQMLGRSVVVSEIEKLEFWSKKEGGIMQVNRAAVYLRGRENPVFIVVDVPKDFGPILPHSIGITPGDDAHRARFMNVPTGDFWPVLPQYGFMPFLLWDSPVAGILNQIELSPSNQRVFSEFHILKQWYDLLPEKVMRPYELVGMYINPPELSGTILPLYQKYPELRDTKGDFPVYIMLGEWLEGYMETHIAPQNGGFRARIIKHWGTNEQSYQHLELTPGESQEFWAEIARIRAATTLYRDGFARTGVFAINDGAFVASLKTEDGVEKMNRGRDGRPDLKIISTSGRVVYPEEFLPLQLAMDSVMYNPNPGNPQAGRPLAWKNPRRAFQSFIEGYVDQMTRHRGQTREQAVETALKILEKIPNIKITPEGFPVIPMANGRGIPSPMHFPGVDTSGPARIRQAVANVRSFLVDYRRHLQASEENFSMAAGDINDVRAGDEYLSRKTGAHFIVEPAPAGEISIRNIANNQTFQLIPQYLGAFMSEMDLISRVKRAEARARAEMRLPEEMKFLFDKALDEHVFVTSPALLDAMGSAFGGSEIYGRANVAIESTPEARQRYARFEKSISDAAGRGDKDAQKILDTLFVANNAQARERQQALENFLRAKPGFAMISEKRILESAESALKEIAISAWLTVINDFLLLEDKVTASAIGTVMSQFPQVDTAVKSYFISGFGENRIDPHATNIFWLPFVFPYGLRASDPGLISRAFAALNEEHFLAATFGDIAPVIKTFGIPEFDEFAKRHQNDGVFPLVLNYLFNGHPELGPAVFDRYLRRLNNMERRFFELYGDQLEQNGDLSVYRRIFEQGRLQADEKVRLWGIRRKPFTYVLPPAPAPVDPARISQMIRQTFDGIRNKPKKLNADAFVQRVKEAVMNTPSDQMITYTQLMGLFEGVTLIRQEAQALANKLNKVLGRTEMRLSKEEIFQDVIARYPAIPWNPALFGDDRAFTVSERNAAGQIRFQRVQAIYDYSIESYRSALEGIRQIRSTIEKGKKITPEQLELIKAIEVHSRLKSMIFTWDERHEKIFPSAESAETVFSYLRIKVQEINLDTFIDRLEMLVLKQIIAIANREHPELESEFEFQEWQTRLNALQAPTVPEPWLLNQVDLSNLPVPYEDVWNFSPEERENFVPAFEKVIEIGTRKRIFAHGTGKAEDSLKRLLNIALEGQVRLTNGDWHVGALQTSGPTRYQAGDFGPYFAILRESLEGRPSQQNDFSYFLVPFPKQQQYARSVIQAAAAQRIISSELAEELSRKFITYEEFIVRDGRTEMRIQSDGASRRVQPALPPLLKREQERTPQQKPETAKAVQDQGKRSSFTSDFQDFSSSYRFQRFVIDNKLAAGEGVQGNLPKDFSPYQEGTQMMDFGVEAARDTFLQGLEETPDHSLDFVIAPFVDGKFLPLILQKLKQTGDVRLIVYHEKNAGRIKGLEALNEKFDLAYEYAGGQALPRSADAGYYVYTLRNEMREAGEASSRRRFQFSMRSLLIAMTLWGVGLGLWKFNEGRKNTWEQFEKYRVSSTSETPHEPSGTIFTFLVRWKIDRMKKETAVALVWDSHDLIEFLGKVGRSGDLPYLAAFLDPENQNYEKSKEIRFTVMHAIAMILSGAEGQALNADAYDTYLALLMKNAGILRGDSGLEWMPPPEWGDPERVNEQRLAALKSLAASLREGTPLTKELVELLIRGKADLNVVEWGLTWNPNPVPVELALHLLKNGKYVYALDALAKNSRETGSPEAFSALLEALKNPDWNFYYNAYGALSKGDLNEDQIKRVLAALEKGEINSGIRGDLFNYLSLQPALTVELQQALIRQMTRNLLNPDLINNRDVSSMALTLGGIARPDEKVPFPMETRLKAIAALGEIAEKYLDSTRRKDYSGFLRGSQAIKELGDAALELSQDETGKAAKNALERFVQKESAPETPRAEAADILKQLPSRTEMRGLIGEPQFGHLSPSSSGLIDLLFESAEEVKRDTARMSSLSQGTSADSYFNYLKKIQQELPANLRSKAVKNRTGIYLGAGADGAMSLFAGKMIFVNKLPLDARIGTKPNYKRLMTEYIAKKFSEGFYATAHLTGEGVLVHLILELVLLGVQRKDFSFQLMERPESGFWDEIELPVPGRREIYDLKFKLQGQDHQITYIGAQDAFDIAGYEDQIRRIAPDGLDVLILKGGESLVNTRNNPFIKNELLMGPKTALITESSLKALLPDDFFTHTVLPDGNSRINRFGYSDSAIIVSRLSWESPVIRPARTFTPRIFSSGLFPRAREPRGEMRSGFENVPPELEPSGKYSWLWAAHRSAAMRLESLLGGEGSVIYSPDRKEIAIYLYGRGQKQIKYDPQVDSPSDSQIRGFLKALNIQIDFHNVTGQELLRWDGYVSLRYRIFLVSAAGIALGFVFFQALGIPVNFNNFMKWMQNALLSFVSSILFITLTVGGLKKWRETSSSRALEIRKTLQRMMDIIDAQRVFDGKSLFEARTEMREEKTGESRGGVRQAPARGKRASRGLPVFGRVPFPEDQIEANRDYFFTGEEWVSEALGNPVWGYYGSGQVRFRRDFVTYPISLSPYFGAMLAEQSFRMWQGMKRAGDLKAGEKFSFIELGAGEGDAARDFLEHAKKNSLSSQEWQAFYEDLEYQIAELSASNRNTIVKKSAEFVEAGKLHVYNENAQTFLEKLKAGSVKGTIFSNELLDAMPVHQVRFKADGTIQTGLFSMTMKMSSLNEFIRLGLLPEDVQIKESPELPGVAILSKADFLKLRTRLNARGAEQKKQAEGKIHLGITFTDAGNFPEVMEYARSNRQEIAAALARAGGADIDTVISPANARLMNRAALVLEKGYLLTVDYFGAARDILNPSRRQVNYFLDSRRRAGADLDLYVRDMSHMGDFDWTFFPDATFAAKAAESSGAETVFWGSQRNLSAGTRIDINSRAAFEEMIKRYLRARVNDLIQDHVAPQILSLSQPASNELKSFRDFLEKQLPYDLIAHKLSQNESSTQLADFYADAYQRLFVNSPRVSHEKAARFLLGVFQTTVNTVQESVKHFQDQRKKDGVWEPVKPNFHMLLQKKTGTDAAYTFPGDDEDVTPLKTLPSKLTPAEAEQAKAIEEKMLSKYSALRDESRSLPLVQTWEEAENLVSAQETQNLFEIAIDIGQEGFLYRGVAGQAAFEDAVQSRLIRPREEDRNQPGSGLWGALNHLVISLGWATGLSTVETGLLFEVSLEEAVQVNPRYPKRPGAMPLGKISRAWLVKGLGQAQTKIVEIRLPGMKVRDEMRTAPLTLPSNRLPQEALPDTNLESWMRKYETIAALTDQADAQEKMEILFSEIQDANQEPSQKVYLKKVFFPEAVSPRHVLFDGVPKERTLRALAYYLLNRGRGPVISESEQEALQRLLDVYNADPQTLVQHSIPSLFVSALKVYFASSRHFIEISPRLQHLSAHKPDNIKAVALALLLHGVHLSSVGTDTDADFRVIIKNLGFAKENLSDPGLDPELKRLLELGILRVSAFLVPFFIKYRFPRQFNAEYEPRADGLAISGKVEVEKAVRHWLIENRAMLNDLLNRYYPEGGSYEDPAAMSFQEILLYDGDRSILYALGKQGDPIPPLDQFLFFPDLWQVRMKREDLNSYNAIRGMRSAEALQLGLQLMGILKEEEFPQLFFPVEQWASAESDQAGNLSLATLDLNSGFMTSASESLVEPRRSFPDRSLEGPNFQTIVTEVLRREKIPADAIVNTNVELGGISWAGLQHKINKIEAAAFDFSQTAVFFFSPKHLWRVPELLEKIAEQMPINSKLVVIASDNSARKELIDGTYIVQYEMIVPFFMEGYARSFDLSRYDGYWVFTKKSKPSRLPEKPPHLSLNSKVRNLVGQRVRDYLEQAQAASGGPDTEMGKRIQAVLEKMPANVPLDEEDINWIYGRLMAFKQMENALPRKILYERAKAVFYFLRIPYGGEVSSVYESVDELLLSGPHLMNRWVPYTGFDQTHIRSREIDSEIVRRAAPELYAAAQALGEKKMRVRFLDPAWVGPLVSEILSLRLPIVKKTEQNIEAVVPEEAVVGKLQGRRKLWEDFWSRIQVRYQEILTQDGQPLSPPPTLNFSDESKASKPSKKPEIWIEYQPETGRFMLVGLKHLFSEAQTEQKPGTGFKSEMRIAMARAGWKIAEGTLLDATDARTVKKVYVEWGAEELTGLLRRGVIDYYAEKMLEASPADRFIYEAMQQEELSMVDAVKAIPGMSHQKVMIALAGNGVPKHFEEVFFKVVDSLGGVGTVASLLENLPASFVKKLRERKIQPRAVRRSARISPDGQSAIPAYEIGGNAAAVKMNKIFQRVRVRMERHGQDPLAQDFSQRLAVMTLVLSANFLRDPDVKTQAALLKKLNEIPAFKNIFDLEEEDLIINGDRAWQNVLLIAQKARESFQKAA